jgi:hypothetical protein
VISSIHCSFKGHPMLLIDKSEKIYCGFILLSICIGSKKGSGKAFLVISHIVCDGEWIFDYEYLLRFEAKTRQPKTDV